MSEEAAATTDVAPIRFDDDGLVPVVAQDAATGEVLMVASMNAAALAATRATDRAHYWSRSRGRLWRKGETSGHEQIVESIAVNCERNSLLLSVRQLGDVCHDGYPTCFYRRLEPDDGLTIVRERGFDPAAVYGDPADVTPPEEPGAVGGVAPERLRLLFGAYAFLRDHDLTVPSATSCRLRSVEDGLGPRVADELGELAGVLDGGHRHLGPREDAMLEAGQVLYWVTLAALRAGVAYDALRPDLALATRVPSLDAGTAARLLRGDAGRWRGRSGAGGDAAARCHATLALVGQACSVAGVSVAEIVERDLGLLREKGYLAAYFASSPSPPAAGRR